MRTVVGPTSRAVVIGAGLAGLSAAMRLAGTGREVMVLEREAGPGGRAGRLVRSTAAGSYRFDTGPTVLTMPDLIDDCFDAVGEDRADWLQLDPVTPLYRARFHDGSSLDVVADTDDMASRIADFAGAAEADGYREYVRFVSQLYRLEMRSFIDRNFDGPLSLAAPDLARLVRIGGMRRLAPAVQKYLKDERLQRVFSFQSLYAGVSPQQALAIYAVIAYMDSVAGVYFPRGGMYALPQAMAAAAGKHGVKFRYNAEVDRIEHDEKRARAVILSDGERIPVDTVVVTTDLPTARARLLRRPLRRPLRSSPSCYLLLAGAPGVDEDAAHHTISFGRSWAGVFDELNSGRLMSDPSVLVSRPTVSDPSLAPTGHSTYYVLFPTPHLRHRTRIDWDAMAPAYREHLTQVLIERGLADLSRTDVEHVITPADWQRMSMHDGTPFAASHVFSQTGPFRPGNLWGENVVFAGSGTVPGVGVPMVLISGRLAAERISGVDGGYQSRAWR